MYCMHYRYRLSFFDKQYACNASAEKNSTKSLLKKFF